MHAFRVCVFIVSCVCTTAIAQTVSLEADVSKLTAAGGDLVLSATTNYQQQPSALGWSIVLPSDWTLASVGGPNVPAIAPPAGSGGTLEFAFTAVPATRAEFAITVRYPANAKSVTLASTVFVRAEGRLTTLTPAPVRISRQGAINEKRPEQ